MVARSFRVAAVLIAIAVAERLSAAPPTAADYFAIEVVDAETGRGVPLVELSTVHNVRYITDSQGLVAFYEPGLMRTRVHFSIRSHGYEFPTDGFGIRGRALEITPGGRAVLKLERKNIAERLYRVTGGGIYRDSLLLGWETPLEQPVINGLVLGQDSVLSAVMGGKLYWFWGDTNRPAYPLGNYHTPGATSELPGRGGLDPDRGVNLHYRVDENGFARPTAQMPGSGPTWLSGLTVVRDANGRERMFAGYAKIKNHLEVYQRGIVEFDTGEEQFQKRLEHPLETTLYPRGHPFAVRSGDEEYVYYADPYPLVRVKATPEAVLDPSQYQAYTCLAAGGSGVDAQVERDAGGRPVWGWKRATSAITAEVRKQLGGKLGLRPGESLPELRDAETGKAVAGHGGSVYFNAYRGRWVMICLELFGTSPLGELWYAEADSPLGPWAYARKIVTHEQYSFYNPKQHPAFDQQGGRLIYFEGTYTAEFSGNKQPTPWYNYNQIMYRADLADPRLVLPVPVYRLAGEERERLATLAQGKPADQSSGVAFFACDRPRPGLLPLVWQQAGDSGQRRLRLGEARTADQPVAGDVLAFVLPADGENLPLTSTALYECVSSEGDRIRYLTADVELPAGYTRGEEPLCRVWKVPAGMDNLPAVGFGG